MQNIYLPNLRNSQTKQRHGLKLQYPLSMVESWFPTLVMSAGFLGTSLWVQTSRFSHINNNSNNKSNVNTYKEFERKDWLMFKVMGFGSSFLSVSEQFHILSEKPLWNGPCSFKTKVSRGICNPIRYCTYALCNYFHFTFSNKHCMYKSTVVKNF